MGGGPYAIYIVGGGPFAFISYSWLGGWRTLRYLYIVFVGGGPFALLFEFCMAGIQNAPRLDLIWAWQSPIWDHTGADKDMQREQYGP